MNANKEKLWTGQYILIMLLCLSIFIVHFILLVSIPVYIKQHGGTDTAAGLSTGLYSLSALFFRPIIGNFLDHYGRKPVLIAGLIPWFAGVIALNFISYTPLLLAIRIIQGLGFSVASTACATIATDLVPKSRLTEGIGYYGALLTITNAIGPLIGLFIIDNISYDFMFFSGIPLTIIAIALSMFLKNGHKKNKTQNKKKSRPTVVIVEKTAIRASLFMMFTSLTYGTIVTFLTTFGKSRGIDNMQFFFLIFPAAVIVSRIITAKTGDVLPPLSILIPAATIIIIGLNIIYKAGTEKMFIIAAIIYGMGYGCLHPMLNMLAVKNCSHQKRGAANATFYMAQDIGIGGGTILLGIMARFFGSASVFLIAAIFMSTGLILFLTLEGLKKIKKETKRAA